MFGDSPHDGQQRISFLLIPGFSLIGLAAMMDPLRWANRLTEQPLYQWSILSIEGNGVEASNGLCIVPDQAISAIESTDTLIVCAGFHPDDYATASLSAELRRISLRGADIGGQDTGSYLLASAGILDGYRATIHWEQLENFSEVFPKVNVVDEIFEIDRDRFSCSGGLSGLDLMLHLIGHQHGRDLAQKVSEQLIYSQHRPGDQPQRLSVEARFGISHPKLVAAIKTMQQRIEDPLPIAQLAPTVHVSERELERLFQRFLKTSPAQFYRQLRLDQARQLLQQTSRSVTNIAIASGFASVSHFSRSYQQYFGLAPSRDRLRQ